MREINCEWCGEKFEALTKKYKYCSSKCKKERKKFIYLYKPTGRNWNDRNYISPESWLKNKREKYYNDPKKDK